MTRRRLTYMLGHGATVAHYPLLNLQTENILHLLRRLPHEEVMSWVVANYPRLVRLGIAPRITDTEISYYPHTPSSTTCH